jgi:hypothetical protein
MRPPAQRCMHRWGSYSNVEAILLMGSRSNVPTVRQSPSASSRWVTDCAASDHPTHLARLADARLALHVCWPHGGGAGAGTVHQPPCRPRPEHARPHRASGHDGVPCMLSGPEMGSFVDITTVRSEGTQASQRSQVPCGPYRRRVRVVSDVYRCARRRQVKRHRDDHADAFARPAAVPAVRPASPLKTMTFTRSIALRRDSADERMQSRLFPN